MDRRTGGVTPDESGGTERPDPPDGVPPRVGAGLLDEQMGPSSAMAHLYRGEIHRMKLWRQRLDRTTNWAVLLLAGVLTWAFSAPSNPHYVLLIGGLTVGLFLTVEAHRYRAYDLWRGRVRSLQRHVWAPGLDPERELDDGAWRRALAADYAEPTLKITLEEAIAHRLRRVYLPLLVVLVVAWGLRVTAFDPHGWPASAAVGSVPGLAVTGLVGTALAVATVVAYRPRTWQASDELRTEDLHVSH